MDQSTIKGKICGSLLGVVVGDLLGEQVEHNTSPGIVKEFRKGARYTDDTEMTLITLQHLNTFKDIKPTTLSIEYAANADYSRKYGGNSSKTMRRISCDPETWDKAYLDYLPYGSWGNGCLMRISPIALFNLKSDEQTLLKNIKDCLISTHNSDESISCSLQYCLLIKNLFFAKPGKLKYIKLLNEMIRKNFNQRLTDKLILIHQQMIENDIVDTYEKLFEFINKDLCTDKIRSSDTLALVIAMLMFNFKYEKWSPTELLIITVSLGGDTDTNAAIIGSLIGALYGIKWITVPWFRNIEDKDTILEKINTFEDIVQKKFESN